MGQQIGKYEIRDEIGRGGFGRVLRAYDPTMDAFVAVKVLAHEDDYEMLSRFRTEAGLMRKLQHENVVTVYEYGEQAESPYIVMELLEGKTLDCVLKERQPLTLVEKMRIMRQIAEGLLYAHRCEVIHRDVKPGNVMLLPDGRVKLMDFGIARFMAAESTRHTHQGQVLGTTFYVAPELFQGEEASVQSDVFSYGAMYYQLMSGVHPFDAEDFTGVAYRIISTEPVPLHEVVTGCPQALSAVIHRAMAKDLAWRYSGFEELLFDSDPIQSELEREEALRMTEEATAAYKNGNIRLAEERAKQALQIDNRNREAHELWRRIRAQWPPEVRDAGRAEWAKGLKRLVEDVEWLLSDSQLRAAREALESGRRKFSATPEFLQLERRLEAGEEKADRRERMQILESGIATVKELLQHAERSEALAALNALSEKFPGVKAIENLRALILAEIEGERRTKDLDHVLRQVHAKISAMKGNEALALLENEGARFADEPLENWIAAARAIVAVNERQRALARVLSESQSLREAGQQNEALALLREHTEMHGACVRTAEAMRVLELELASKRADAEIAGYKTRAATLIAAEARGEALALLKHALRKFPGEPVLELLAAEAGELQEPLLALAATVSGVQSTQRQDRTELATTLNAIGKLPFYLKHHKCQSCGRPLPDNEAYCDACRSVSR